MATLSRKLICLTQNLSALVWGGNKTIAVPNEPCKAYELSMLCSLSQCRLKTVIIILSESLVGTSLGAPPLPQGYPGDPPVGIELGQRRHFSSLIMRRPQKKKPRPLENTVHARCALFSIFWVSAGHSGEQWAKTALWIVPFPKVKKVDTISSKSEFYTHELYYHKELLAVLAFTFSGVPSWSVLICILCRGE